MSNGVIFIDSERFERILNKLVDKIRPYVKDFRYIIGVPNGGTLVACFLSYKLKLPLIFNVDGWEYVYRPDELLIVDDFYETGKTLDREPWSSLLKKGAKLAILINKNKDCQADFVGENIITNEYIEMFWE